MSEVGSEEEEQRLYAQKFANGLNSSFSRREGNQGVPQGRKSGGKLNPLRHSGVSTELLGVVPWLSDVPDDVFPGRQHGLVHHQTV